MTANGIVPNSDWEKHKFEVEVHLKERELQLSRDRLRAENFRNILIGVLVPVVVALMTAVPAYLNSWNQQILQKATFEAQLILQKATFEAQLITDSVKTGDPDQAAVNLSFLVQSGLLSRETATRVDEYLQAREPGKGRALPAR